MKTKDKTLCSYFPSKNGVPFTCLAKTRSFQDQRGIPYHGQDENEFNLFSDNIRIIITGPCIHELVRIAKKKLILFGSS